MTENEIKNYLELGNLVVKIEAQAFNIEKGDLGFQIQLLDRFPYFDSSKLVELWKDALKEYYEMLITAFYSSCKFIYEASDPTIFEAINACVEHFNNVIAHRGYAVQGLPLAETLYKLYNCAYAKLLKAGLKENASNLEKLKKNIFHGWVAIG